MALIRGTRAAHDGRPQHGGGPPPAVRYAAGPIWPGITAGHDARCSCTWAMRAGRYEIKFLHALCEVPGHRSVARA